MKNHEVKTNHTGAWRNDLAALAGGRKGILGLVFGLAMGAMTPVTAAPPGHNISAGNVTVIQNDAGNTVASVTTSVSLSINDFRVRGNGGGGSDSFSPQNSAGDFAVQAGVDASDDFTNGILMAAITQNGRDNGSGAAGTNYCVVMMDNQRTSATDISNSNNIVGAYLIDVSAINALAAGSNPEYNINVAGAWFPYTQFYGGFARNNNATNGGAMNELIGTPGLAIGVNFFDLGGGKSFVTLTNLGIDSRTDGILIVNGAKNESANFGLSQMNTTNGGWNLFVHDDGANTTSYEQDPIAFVFIPKTNTTVVSGRFQGNGGIQAFSGASAAFTVTSNAVGIYELKIPGKSPTNGVLIVSCEGGTSVNNDNAVSYEVNAAQDGWIIQSRDCPAGGLESPAATEAVASFVYIPGPTPGFTVTPTNNLFTSENGTTAAFTVVLDKQPTADVTIPVSSSNTAEGTVDQSSLTFNSSNWNVPQTVTITGVDDAVIDGAVAYTIVLGAATSADGTYNGLDPADVSVSNQDNDGGITVAPTSGLVTTEAGGTATFAVHLNAVPSANVTIAISSSNTGEGTVSPSSLTFNTVNWATDQIVTVTGVNDFVQDGNKNYTVITGVASSTDPNYNGLNPADVAVVNQDNDVAGVTVSAEGPPGLTVVEGQQVNYTVVLNSQPTANVTVNVASSNTGQGGTPAPTTLTFTSLNWSNAQTVTSTAADDFVQDGNTVWTNVNTFSSSDPLYAALPAIPVTMTTLDNEPLITLPVGTMIYGIGLAGVGIDGTATIADPNTATYPGGTMTVTLTANGSSDDRLEVRNTGTGAGQIGVSGNLVSYGGVTIGTNSGGVGVSPLVIKLNGSATPASAQALLRSVTFRNVNSNASRATRTVTASLAHADGGVGAASAKIRVGLLRVADFQEGADHGYGIYTGENDTQLREADPNTPYPAGNASGLFIDWPDAGVHNAYNVLMRFDNIFGNGFGQIPTNATIVSADLMLNYTDSGDGSPLYRMLVPFDATNETWTSMGGDGVQQDGIESMTTFDSQIGVSDGSGSTSIAPGTVTVTPDIVAWELGQANYGWVMPGWNGNTDGTGVSPGEAANIPDRPRLRVLWLPADPAIAQASLQQGLNGYTNAMDTRVRQTSNTTSYATVATVFVDYAVSFTSDPEHVLIRFDNLIGTGTNQVPAGAEVEAAVLDLASVGGNAMGNGGTFHLMLQPWQDTNTWDDLVNGISADDVEAVSANSAIAGSPLLGTAGFVPGGYHTFEMSDDVQSWASGTRPNYGWAILPFTNGTDGWGIATSETGTQKDRPQLRVYYKYVPSLHITSISRGPTSATINFTGAPLTLYSVRRSTTVNGTYTQIGTATTLADGTASYTDNSPPAGSAFYRIYP